MQQQMSKGAKDLSDAGPFIRLARLAARMPQGLLARAVGISQKELCLREQGKRPIASLKELIALQTAIWQFPFGNAAKVWQALGRFWEPADHVATSAERHQTKCSKGLPDAGPFIRDARLSAHMPQGDLARAVGISQKELCLREQGKRPIASVEELIALKDAIWTFHCEHSSDTWWELGRITTPFGGIVTDTTDLDDFEGPGREAMRRAGAEMIRLCASLTRAPSLVPREPAGEA